MLATGAVLFLAAALLLDLTGTGHSFPIHGHGPHAAAGGRGPSL